MSGTLFLVATPIGNLEDITLRALRVLREVAVVAAEDTRRTGNLLRHFSITTPTVSLHAHNEFERTPSLVARLCAGESVAVVTDAGSPGISDPGLTLAGAARAAGCRVEAIPGPSAVIAALTSAGVPLDDGFAFLGFLPAKSSARRKKLGQMADLLPSMSVVVFETPHRIRQALTESLEVLGERQIIVARELTKVHETVLTGQISQVVNDLGTVAGEYTLVFPKAEAPVPISDTMNPERVFEFFCHTTEKEDLTLREGVRRTAELVGLPVKAVYEIVTRQKAAKADPSR